MVVVTTQSILCVGMAAVCLMLLDYPQNWCPSTVQVFCFFLMCRNRREIMHRILAEAIICAYLCTQCGKMGIRVMICSFNISRHCTQMQIGKTKYVHIAGHPLDNILLSFILRLMIHWEMCGKHWKHLFPSRSF